MLEYAEHIPANAADGAPVLVLLHGRGANRFDLLGLGRHLPEEWILVAPEAPFPAAGWGYGPGSAWYQYAGRNRPEPDSFSASIQHLGELLGNLESLLPLRPGPVVLGGFSQGGTVSLAYGLAAAAGQLPGAASVPAVVNLSGFLADHPAVQASLGGARDLRVFWGHGTEDPNIAFALAAEGRARLVQAGVDVEARDYPIGHWIEAEEVRDVVVWVNDVIAATRGL